MSAIGPITFQQRTCYLAIDPSVLVHALGYHVPAGKRAYGFPKF